MDVKKKNIQWKLILLAYDNQFSQALIRESILLLNVILKDATK